MTSFTKNLIWIFVSISASIQTLAEEVIHVSTGEYPPGYSEYSPHQGYISHILKKAYAQVGVRVVM